MKRKRSAELTEELERQMGCLNRTFHQWIQNNETANQFATWEEGCQDYVTHAEVLQAKFGTRGTAMAFGTGEFGQLGFGVDEGEVDTIVSRPRVIETLQGKEMSALACGGMHNAAVDASTGTVWTWGTEDNGCLGREGDENFPAPVVGLQNKVFVLQVSAGDCHTVALGIDGQVHLWGTFLDNDGRKWFQNGSGVASFGKIQNTPSLVSELSDVNKHGGVTQVTSGSNHVLALCGDGTVYSWGMGDQGQLSRPVCELKDKDGVYQKDLILRDHLTPAIMLYQGKHKVNNARYVAAGSYHSFILQAVRSRVYAAGLNQYGQLALPGTESVKFLTHVEALDAYGISSVLGGEHSSMAISHSGKVYTFGRADSHQLGVVLDKNKLGDAGASTPVPQLVKFDPDVPIDSGYCSSFHAAAIGRDGSLFTWGFGETCQLGHGRSKDEPTPRRVVKAKGSTDPLRVSAVAAGAQHTVVLAQN